MDWFTGSSSTAALQVTGHHLKDGAIREDLGAVRNFSS